MRHLHDVSRRSRRFQTPEQLGAAFPGPLGDHFHPAVGEVLGRAEQPELQRVAPGPPAEADALNPAAHPDRQPRLFAQRGGDVLRSAGPGVVVPLIMAGHQRARRGRGWHRGHRKEDRFMNFSRTISVPQRGHGFPALP